MGKVCSQCNIEKEFTEFSKQRTSRDGNQSKCKKCGKQYRKENKEQLKEYNKQYHIKNKEQLKEYNKQYHIKNKEQIREYTNNRLKTDPLFALTCRIRCLIRGTITNKGYTKKSKTHEILGIDWMGLKEHMERQFIGGMNWENRDQWHIDHIKPCCKFNLLDKNEQIKCFHYTNLQPLWAKDNLSKGGKFNENKL